MLEGDPLPSLFRGTRIYQYLLQTKISLLVFGFLGETRTAVSLLSRCVLSVQLNGVQLLSADKYTPFLLHVGTLDLT